MRYLLLLVLFVTSNRMLAQELYETLGSGNYSGQGSTWTGAGNSHNPPASGDCGGCTIVIKAGHTVTLNTTVTISNAIIILEGSGSQFTFGTDFDLNLTGYSAIDIKNTNARIFGTSSGNVITLGVTNPGTTIYTGGVTMVNSLTPGTVQGLASASSQRTNVTFQNFTLPVTLTGFTVTNKSEKVVINWSTDLEINSDYFQVERSGDGKIWNGLGIVKATGNTSISQQYSYTDNAPLDGENYYRLKIVDLDATHKYSPIKSVNIGLASLSIMASPNPASSTLNITVSQVARKDYQIKLINRSGQVLYNQKYSGTIGRISVGVSQYPEGSYFLELTDATGNRLVKNILILKRK